MADSGAEQPSALDEYAGVDDLMPEGSLPVAFVRCAVYLTTEGKREAVVDWNTDIGSFEFHGLIGILEDAWQTVESVDDEEG